MSKPKIAVMVRKLYDQTEAGTVKWEPTQRDNIFQKSFTDYSVQILPIQDDYVVVVFDSEGRIVEEASDVDLKEHFDNSFSYMRDLYEMARSSALGVDSAIDSIIRELDDNDLPF